MDHIFYLCTIFYSCCFLLLIHSGDSVLLSRFKRGHDSHNWSYTGPNGPSHWGGVCQTGKCQSPINIVSNNTREKSFTPFSFGDNYKTVLNFEAVNDGHTLKVSTTNSTALPTFQGGGLDGKFVFQQLHFHWESEHQIDGVRAALEMHLVHYNSKYKDIGIASLAKDGIAVIAVLCDESEKSDSVLEDFIQNALLHAAEKHNYLGVDDHKDQVKESKEDKIEEKYKLNYKLRDLLPANVDRWFRYEGSLTTPGCDETVMWTVILDRIHVSSKSLASFRRLQDKEGKNLTFTYRPIQALNGRTIYLQVDESYNEVIPDGDEVKTGGSNAIFPNFIVTFALGICALNTLRL